MVGNSEAIVSGHLDGKSLDLIGNASGQEMVCASVTGTKLAFNPPNSTRPPQSPAAPFKPAYRKCLGLTPGEGRPIDEGNEIGKDGL